MSGLLDQFRDETRPQPDALERVRARLHKSAPSPQAARVLLPRLPALGDGQVERVLARLSTPQPRRWPARVGTLALVAVAVLALIVWPEPAPFGGPLNGTGSIEPAPGLVLGIDGEGDLLGEPRDVRIAWTWGRIGVSLDPDVDADLAVETPEGLVRVVGTRFAITRDELGTHVAVDKGRVLVQCADDGPLFLERGGAQTCLPVGASGRLRRLRALLSANGPSPELLVELRETNPQGDDPAGYELLALEVELLSHTGRFQEALDAAVELSAVDGPRQDDLLASAAALAHALHGCDAARPHLDQLIERGSSSLVPQLLEDCPEAP